MACRKIIVPSHSPGGLDSVPYEHFGQCPVFTAVAVEENAISSVDVIPNSHVGCRNCFEPIKYLWERGMSALLVYKLGVFPLRILDTLEIPVFRINSVASVQEAVEAYLQGQLKVFTPCDTCSGECEL